MVTHNVAEIIREHVTMEVEGIDRMYLNAYVPGLQPKGDLSTSCGTIWDFRSRPRR